MIGSSYKATLLSGQVSQKQELIFTIFVSMLCATVYLASDVFLPSLPEMTHYFHTSASIAQITLTIFMIGLASSQIMHGLLSDRFGRKTILKITIPFFLIATIGCIFAQNIETLIVFRFIQAIAASSCLVIGRSLFTDLFEAKRAQRAFAVLVPLVSLSPALAPTIGGILATYFSWQSAFIFILIFGIFIFLASYFSFYQSQNLLRKELLLSTYQLFLNH